MASVCKLLPTPIEYYETLQQRNDIAENHRHMRFMAVLLLQRMTRGYLIRKHMAWLAKNAITIQCAFRVRNAQKIYRAYLRRAVRQKHGRHYALASKRLQALWRGHYSRRTKFCYRRYRRWLAAVTERGERRAAEAAEFGIRSRADNLRILEEEARNWLAFVVFKLHHLLRTYARAGVYSQPATTQLSDFEKLLTSINYTEYMKRLRRKYNEFVRKHRPRFSNKRLFPVIGEGADYWYLSLAEMYELTAPVNAKPNTRTLPFYHGPIHTEPFLWRKLTPPVKYAGRGPFTPSKPETPASSSLGPPAPAPSPMPMPGVVRPQKDPIFHLYVKHYTPQPNLMDYVDFHINVLVNRKCSVQNIDIEE